MNDNKGHVLHSTATNSRTPCGTAIGQVSKLDTGQKRFSPQGKTGGIDELYRAAKSLFEKERRNTVDKGLIEMPDGLEHSSEKITVITPLNHKVKVRMKNLGDDVWDTTLVYVRLPHRVGKFKGWHHATRAATKKAIEIADAP